ncbi:MAG: exo-beta-N-acetylmuramidase NamZ domain-containing protein [Elusimicrobiota bacterium]
MKKALALVGLLALAACAEAPARTARVLSGLDVLEAEGFAPLKGKRVGVITNHTGVDSRGVPIVELLADATGVTLVAVFTPEHGFGAASEADNIASTRILAGGREFPLYSLYKGGTAGMRPQPSELSGIDVLIFDIQDVGARFYTYLATMGMALEAARDAGIEFVVLDRPNPIRGDVVEGPLVDEPDAAGKDQLLYFDVPTRHGLTAGEMALLHNATAAHPRLTVVKMRNWKRAMWYDQTGLPWIAPSPNMPDLAAAALYPGVANLEFSNLSVGRGTKSPFGWIGAPWLDAKALEQRMNQALMDGVDFSVETRTPSKDIYAGKPCAGLRITVTARDAARPLRVFAELVAALRDLQPNDFKLDWTHSRRLVGSERFHKLYDSGATGAEMTHLFDSEASEFEKTRAPYLLY